MGGTHIGGAGPSTSSDARVGAADWRFQDDFGAAVATKGLHMTTIMSVLVAHQDRLFTRHDERGATATEYALLLAFIAVVIITAVALFGTNLAGLFGNAVSSV